MEHTCRTNNLRGGESGQAARVAEGNEQDLPLTDAAGVDAQGHGLLVAVALARSQVVLQDVRLLLELSLYFW